MRNDTKQASRIWRFRQKRVWIEGLVAVVIGVAMLILIERIAQWGKYQGWTVYHSPDSSLASDFIGTLAVDVQDWVWVGTNDGLSVLDPDGNWATYTKANSGLPSDSVPTLAIDGQGRVWTNAGVRLSVLDPDGSWTTYKSLPKEMAWSGRRVDALAVDRHDRVWAISGVGLGVLGPDGRWETYHPNPLDFGASHSRSGSPAHSLAGPSVGGNRRQWPERAGP